MRNLVDLQRKLHGWHGTYRGRFMLLQNKTLTKEEFILYEASLSFSDWDSDKRTYGSFDLSQQEIELLIGFPAGFVSKRKNKLIRLGLWIEREDGRIQVNNLQLTEVSTLKVLAKENPLIDPVILFAKKQNQFVSSQNKIANEQTNHSKAREENELQNFANSQNQSPISDLLSSKDKHLHASLVSTSSIKASGLTKDDEDWIDKNLQTESEGSS